MLTPQQLIDMPGYGNAEKYLRKTGKWRLTPHEHVIKLLKDFLRYTETSIDSAYDALLKLEDDN